MPAASPIFPPSILAGTLQRQHAEYKGDLWSTLSDFYAGGEAIESHKTRYLPRLAVEQSLGATYNDRLAATSYLNYLGQIIDYFASALFGQDLAIKQPSDANNKSTPGDAPENQDDYSAFARDADLAGTPFADVEKAVFRTAILKKRGLLAIDFPTVEESATLTSLADEDEIGTNRPYAFELPVEQMINWAKLPRGAGFLWCVLYRQRLPDTGPTGGVNGVVHEWKIWQLVDGVAVWATYVWLETKETPLKDDSPVPLKDTSDTTFQSIPILEIEMPDGLWVGNKIIGPCREHFVRRSCLIAAENKSLYAIPVAKLGSLLPADGSIPSPITDDPERADDPAQQFARKGYATIGKDDSIEFAEPSGAAYIVVDTQLKELVDEIFRVVHQMAASVTNTTKALGRSGMSKQADMAVTTVVLTEYGRRVRTHAKRVYDTISKARKESVSWNVHGLEKYDLQDRQSIIMEATQVDLVAIPSKLFKQEYKTQIALQLLPNASPDTQEAIRAEIKAGVSSEFEMKAAMQDATLDAAQNPAPTVVAGKPAPGKPGVADAKKKPAPAAA